MTKGSRKVMEVLPNAPLVEVIFELRWALPDTTASAPQQLMTDPAYFFLQENFRNAAARHQFRHEKNILPKDTIAGAHSIASRFYMAEDKPFPLWQIGPGIFACNMSSSYEWSAFKRLALKGVKTLLASYPKSPTLKLRPIHLELRYLDSFDLESSGNVDVIEFLNANTSLGIQMPNFFSDGAVGVPASTLFQCQFPVKKRKHTSFIFQVGNGLHLSKKALILESKVLTKAPPSKPTSSGRAVPDNVKNIDAWLEDAHAITSPFFKDFVTETLLKKFEG